MNEILLWHRNPFPGIKGPGPEFAHSLHLAPPNMSSWHNWNRFFIHYGF